MKNIKLNKIIVENLFGIFNHEVSISESAITIIIGENGLGKTILLEMIEAFFKSDFSYFETVVFNNITFVFSDDVSWIIKKEDETQESKLIVTQKDKRKKKLNPYTIDSYNDVNINMMAKRIARHHPSLIQIGSNIWKSKGTGRVLSSRELVNVVGKAPLFDDASSSEDVPKWFSDRQTQLKVSLIETQRLISLDKRDDKPHEKTVEKYSKELSGSIKSDLSESTELSSKLDRTYPNRLIERIKRSSNVTDTNLNEELQRLEKKRELLDTVGLIEIEKESNILEIEETTQEVLKVVLMLYVEDSFKKIEIFDLLSRKIEILLRIINKRFKHKRLYIDKEEGFLFRSTIIKNNKNEYQRIPVTKLSSGEQNELVLFYLLLFKTESNSLILIDEPELSLHISWQNCFIEDIKEISKLNNLDVVIATHSPDIISNNWDLTTELKGVE